MSSKIKVTAATEYARPALVPKLRFPAFRGVALRCVQLGDVTEEGRRRNGKKHSAASVMGVTKADGIVPMEARLIAADIERYKLVEHNWFAYNPMRLNIGSIARWKGDSEILVSPDYVVFKCITDDESGMTPSYLDQFRQTKVWEDFVTEGGDGGVRVRIYYKDIARLQLALPSLPEQERIAECLNSVDELMAAQARKVAALKTHKKGLMQQLFPREGETQPRLRFPEFKNAGEWEETRLGQLGKLVSGLTYSPDDVRDSGLLVLRSSNVQNGAIALDDNVYVDPAIKGANLSQPDDILICVRNGSKALIGKSALIPEGMPLCTHGAFMTVFRARKPGFVFQLFQTDKYQKQVSGDLGATINSINGSQLLKYKFVVPKPDEQQRIASCLNSLDTLITAETQRFEALKTYKKGLMQQLFPSLAEVEA